MGQQKSENDHVNDASGHDLLKALIESDPQFTILSDHPLKPDEVDQDSFALNYHMGPIYDIVRHPGTDLPLTIAVYGSWGTGKTSAMKWLNGLLDEWNKLDKVKDGEVYRIKPIWFYPWKYHNKEDVWRGLLAELILKSITIEDANIHTVIKAGKQVLQFLGRGALSAAGDLVGIDADKIFTEYELSIQPQNAYLNEFEVNFNKWITATLSPKERLIIFIDDLDRCLPDVALQVLEALKLYLNNNKLIFVVGVDKIIINDLVRKYYGDLGVEKAQARNYLAKMFQVEIDLNPSGELIEKFLLKHLEDFGVFRNQKISDTEEQIFCKVILGLAGRIPREVKRLINSALLAGSGTSKLRGDEGLQKISFVQGMQVFFVRKILDDRHQGKSSIVGSPNGLDTDFFGEWSRIVRNYEGNEYFKRSFRLSDDYREYLTDSDQIDEGRRLKILQEIDLAFTPLDYHGLLKNSKYNSCIGFLGDELLGELMRIEYPASTKAIGEAIGVTPDETLIREAIARELGKKIEDLTHEDYWKIQKLKLSNTSITDIAVIEQLINLKTLNLESTQVINLDPLRDLKYLEGLTLNSSMVSVIAPLESLNNLTKLNLSFTQVSNFEPIGHLKKLALLSLNRTHIRSLTPLTGLSELDTLYLSHTPISDLKPIKDLNKLSILSLNGSKVKNLDPLKDLTNLTSLNLSNLDIQTLEPIMNLSMLSNLSLTGSHIDNLIYVKSLLSLHTLHLSRTQISDIEPLKGLTRLERLNLASTNVSNLEPLIDLTSLVWLYLSKTSVSDLEPLTGLTALRELFLTSTKVSDIEPLAGLTLLEKLDLSDTRVSNIGPIIKNTNLKVLNLHGTDVNDLKPLEAHPSLFSISITAHTAHDPVLLRMCPSLKEVYLNERTEGDLDQDTIDLWKKCLPSVNIFVIS